MRLLVLFVLTLFQLKSYAQKVSIQPVAGAQFSVLTLAKGPKQTQVQPAVVAGLDASLPLHRQFFSSLGLRYQQQSGHIGRVFVYRNPVLTDAPEVREKFTMRFLALPLSVGWKSEQEAYWFVSAGGTARYTLSNYRSGEVVDRRESFEGPFLLRTANGKRIGFAWNAQAGKMFHVSSQNLSARILFEWDQTRWLYVS